MPPPKGKGLILIFQLMPSHRWDFTFSALLLGDCIAHLCLAPRKAEAWRNGRGQTKDTEKTTSEPGPAATPLSPGLSARWHCLLPWHWEWSKVTRSWLALAVWHPQEMVGSAFEWPKPWPVASCLPHQRQALSLGCVTCKKVSWGWEMCHVWFKSPVMEGLCLGLRHPGEEELDTGVRSPWLLFWGWFTLWLWVFFMYDLLESLFWSKVIILVTTGHQYHICQPLYFVPAQTEVCCHNCRCLGKTRTQNFWKTCFCEISNPN